uniref:Uncharacterized protein n=1 Tax=Steinernema glaseri TaxID=37863 RepID=A0A1I7YBM3_9BILA
MAEHQPQQRTGHQPGPQPGAIADRKALPCPARAVRPMGQRGAQQQPDR